MIKGNQWHLQNKDAGIRVGLQGEVPGVGEEGTSTNASPLIWKHETDITFTCWGTGIHAVSVSVLFFSSSN